MKLKKAAATFALLLAMSTMLVAQSAPICVTDSNGKITCVTISPNGNGT